MDKFENKVKLDEIKSLIQQGLFEDAVDVADTVDWASVKNVRTLCLISDLYKKNRLFEESRDILLYAYNKQKARPIIKSLCELSIELNDLIAAMEYCKEFIQIAPKDPSRYILQYKLFKAQGISLEEQIGVLEELKAHEYLERWAYELAEMYHKVGMEDKCVDECNELILWFVDGKYVIKAYELKAQHKPLTEQETYKYELLRQAGGELNIQCSLREDENSEAEEKKDLEVKNVDVSPYNTQNIQAFVAEGLQDLLDQGANNVSENVPETREEAVALDEEVIEAAAPEVDPELLVTQMYNPIVPEAPVGQDLEETDEEVVPEEGNGLSDSAIIGDVSKELAEEKLKEKSYQLHQDTDEIKMITEEDLKEESEKAEAPVANESFENEFIASNPETAQYKPDFSNTGIIETFHKGTNMDTILSQEYDGQISLVVPEEENVEKQITGQISIDDVMREWELKKKADEARRIAEVREQVRKQTSELLSSFDDSTKSGLLEKIENEMITAALNEERAKQAAKRPKQIKVADIDKVEETPDEGVEELEEIKDNLDDEKNIPELEEEVFDNNEVTSEKEEDVEEQIPTDDAEDEFEELEETEDSEVIEETEEEDDFDEEIEESEVTDDFDDYNSEENDESEDDEDYPEEDEEIEKTVNKNRRELSESEKERFAAFIHHRSTQRQLAEALDNISLASYTGNVLVTSDADNEITTFSKLLIQEIQLSDGNFTGKVAKVSGENLNRKDIGDTLKCVSNGALIISEAEGLKKKTVETLINELQHSNRGVVVIMQGNGDIIDKIVEKNPGVAEAFNLRIDLKAFDNKTLVEYAKSYAYDNEYAIDELGILALHTRIDDMQTANHDVTLSEIEEIIDDAIYYADKKTPSHFFDILFGKRYDEEDMVILREKDFMHY